MPTFEPGVKDLDISPADFLCECSRYEKQLLVNILIDESEWLESLNVNYGTYTERQLKLLFNKVLDNTNLLLKEDIDAIEELFKNRNLI